MSDDSSVGILREGWPVDELRRSVSLLATEWWVLVGGLVLYLAYGVWVVGTGVAVSSVPALAGLPLTTVSGVTVTGLVVATAVLWLIVPALVVSWLVELGLSNNSGNLKTAYRLDHPSALLVPSGVVMLLVPVVSLVVGRSVPLTVVTLVASVHFCLRTIAYGRRVYTLSRLPLFSTLTVLSGVALGAGWVLHATMLPGSAGQLIARGSVPSVVNVWTTLAGVSQTPTLAILVTVPALLSGLYVAVQTVAGHRVRSRAPLESPSRRAEQRFPIMPPVANSSVSPSVDSSTASNETAAATHQQTNAENEPQTGTDDETDEPPAAEHPDEAGNQTDETDDDSSHTRVFTTDEPVPTDGETVAVTQDEDDDDGWIDDTAIFSPERDRSKPDECGACGVEIPRESSVTYCPQCGEQISD